MSYDINQSYRINLAKRVVDEVKAKSGVTTIEYGLVAALIAVAVIVAVTLVGTNLAGLFTYIAGQATAPGVVLAMILCLISAFKAPSRFSTRMAPWWKFTTCRRFRTGLPAVARSMRRCLPRSSSRAMQPPPSSRASTHGQGKALQAHLLLAGLRGRHRRRSRRRWRPCHVHNAPAWKRAVGLTLKSKDAARSEAII